MKIDKEKLKLIGGALIVLAAAGMMFNQLFSFAAGLFRMVSMIGVALVIAYLMTRAMVSLRGKKKTRPAKIEESSDNVEESQLSEIAQRREDVR